jgi:hypothetical protein
MATLSQAEILNSKHIEDGFNAFHDAVSYLFDIVKKEIRRRVKALEPPPGVRPERYYSLVYR